MSGVRDTSLSAYEKKRASLTKDSDQDAVLAILEEVGPMDDVQLLGALNKKERVTLKPKRQRRKWTINLITPRRGELVALGLVEDLGKYKRPGRKYPVHLWRARCDSRQPVGWSKIETSELPAPRKPPEVIRRQQAERTEEIERPILNRLRVSEAGRVLREHRRVKGRKTTARTGQGLLNFA